jgi:hypothetical protein
MCTCVRTIINPTAGNIFLLFLNSILQVPGTTLLIKVKLIVNARERLVTSTAHQLYNFTNFGNQKSKLWSWIRIALNSWIRIRIETNADPQHR